MNYAGTIDPVCLLHGKKKSKHRCVVCCICYKDLPTDEDCWQDVEGQRWDMCHKCAVEEAALREEPKP